MRGTPLLRALPALLWLSGCVAILGVDSEEYQDLDEAMCSCFEGSNSVCEGFIQAFSEVPGFQGLANGCIESSSTCLALGDCLYEGGICVDVGGGCDAFDGTKKTLQFRCCGELVCTDGGTCELPCQALAQACGGDDGECCGGTVCSEETSLCCRPPGGECDPVDVSSPCCGELVCSELGKCAVCSPEGTGCSDQEPCCAGFECTQTDVATVCLLPT